MTEPDDESLIELLERIDDLENWRTHHSALVDELLNGTPAAETEAPAEVLDLDTLVRWVHEYVTAVIARPLRGEVYWCPQWWEHAEAIFRFEALRRAWVELTGEPGSAMSVWIRDHLDPCLTQLLAPTGPFVDCMQTERHRGSTEHRPLPTLPTSTPD